MASNINFFTIGYAVSYKNGLTDDIALPQINMKKLATQN